MKEPKRVYETIPSCILVSSPVVLHASCMWWHILHHANDTSINEATTDQSHHWRLLHPFPRHHLYDGDEISFCGYQCRHSLSQFFDHASHADNDDDHSRSVHPSPRLPLQHCPQSNHNPGLYL